MGTKSKIQATNNTLLHHCKLLVIMITKCLLNSVLTHNLYDSGKTCEQIDEKTDTYRKKGSVNLTATEEVVTRVATAISVTKTYLSISPEPSLLLLNSPRRSCRPRIREPKIKYWTIKRDLDTAKWQMPYPLNNFFHYFEKLRSKPLCYTIWGFLIKIRLHKNVLNTTLAISKQLSNENIVLVMEFKHETTAVTDTPRLTLMESEGAGRRNLCSTKMVAGSTVTHC